MEYIQEGYRGDVISEVETKIKIVVMAKCNDQYIYLAVSIYS
jgi:hypothetical protein